MGTSVEGPGGLSTSHFSSFLAEISWGAPLPPSFCSFFSSVALDSGSCSRFCLSLSCSSGGFCWGAGAGAGGCWAPTRPEAASSRLKRRGRIDFISVFPVELRWNGPGEPEAHTRRRTGSCGEAGYEGEGRGVKESTDEQGHTQTNRDGRAEKAQAQSS